LLAEMAGMPMPEERADDGVAALRRRILEINREAARYYHGVLVSEQGRRGLEYFTARGLSAHTITAFGLGYAPDRWDSLLKHMTEAGFTPEELRQAALAETGRNGGWYDKFRNRVMFPIIDVRGGVVGFGGRVLDDSKPKYLNSSDTPVFKKSRCLYALNAAKSSNETLILCEGYMDVIAMHQAGFTNAIATLGTALTTDQARLMARYCKQIIVSYDADEAGRIAAQRAIGLLDEAGLGVRVLRIEGGKDPDEFIKTHGADKFRMMLEKCGGHVEFRLTQEKAKYDLSRPEQKVAFLKKAVEILASLSSPLELEVYASRLAHELEISKDSLIMEAAAVKKRGGQNREKARLRKEISSAQGAGDRVNPEKVRHLRAANAEEELIALLYGSPALLRQMDALITPGDFVTVFNRRVYEALRAQITAGGGAELSMLNAQFTPDEIARITGMLVKWKVSGTSAEARDLAGVIKFESALQRNGQAIAEAAAGSAPEDMNNEEFRNMIKVINRAKTEEKNGGGNC
ncbi:MAG: DNA primase, partial [Clostridia bacterium]|nr:DNA primase [Clostridia bacterium]